MKHLAIVVFLFFAGAPADGGEPAPGFGAQFTGTHTLAMEINRLVMLLGDDGLRDLVCRLSSERYTFGRLSSALGLPEGQVVQRINTLRGWGLVHTVRQSSASTVVEALPGDGAKTLRRWAARYCPSGDNCGRPSANPDSRPEGRERSVSGAAGIVPPNRPDSLLQGKLVTVFGGAGFLGRDLVERLLAAGARVRIASRNPDAATFSKSLVANDQLSKMVVDARRGRGVATAVAGADLVVNLVGIQRETDVLKFADLNDIAARTIAAASASENVERLVHVSFIGPALESRSMFSRTKVAGEAAVREEFPNVTIVRPSLVLGADGGFLKRLRDVSRQTPVLPFIREGKPLFQPIYVGDVSRAIIRILVVSETKGLTFELGGSTAMTMYDIIALASSASGHDPPASTAPEEVEEARTDLLHSLPRSLWEPGREEFTERDFVVRPNTRGLADLGITPTPIEDVVAANDERN